MQIMRVLVKVLAKGEFPFTYLKISLLKSLILPNILILELWQTSSISYQTLELEDIKNKLNRWPWVNSWPCWCRPHFVALNISKLQFYTFQLEKKLRLSSKIQFNLQAQIVSKHTYLHWEIKKKKVMEGNKDDVHPHLNARLCQMFFCKDDMFSS